MYCRNCSYLLRGLPEPRCPECGAGFDPADSHTWLDRPIHRPLAKLGGLLRWITAILTCAIAALNVAWCGLGFDSIGLWAGLILLAPLVLFVWAVSAAILHVARAPSRRRLTYAFWIGLAVWASVPTTSWPLRLHFALYRARLDNLADRLEHGETLEMPLRMGVFTIQQSGLSNRDVPFFWSNIRYGGNDGFVRCPGWHRPPFNLWSSYPLGGGWWFIEED